MIEFNNINKKIKENIALKLIYLWYILVLVFLCNSTQLYISLFYFVYLISGIVIFFVIKKYVIYFIARSVNKKNQSMSKRVHNNSLNG